MAEMTPDTSNQAKGPPWPDGLYFEDKRYPWHRDHPFDPEMDCCLEAVASLMGFSWREWQASRTSTLCVECGVAFEPGEYGWMWDDDPQQPIHPSCHSARAQREAT